MRLVQVLVGKSDVGANAASNCFVALNEATRHWESAGGISSIQRLIIFYLSVHIDSYNCGATEYARVEASRRVNRIGMVTLDWFLAAEAAVCNECVCCFAC